MLIESGLDHVFHSPMARWSADLDCRQLDLEWKTADYFSDSQQETALGRPQRPVYILDRRDKRLEHDYVVDALLDVLEVPFRGNEDKLDCQHHARRRKERRTDESTLSASTNPFSASGAEN